MGGVKKHRVGDHLRNHRAIIPLPSIRINLRADEVGGSWWRKVVEVGGDYY